MAARDGRTVIGVSAYHGDSSAALVRDGQLIGAVEEERFTRVKHWAGFPRASIGQCLAMAEARADDVDHFAIARDPRAHLWRKALFALRRRPGPALVRDRLRNRRRVSDVAGALGEAFGMDAETVRRRTHWVEHHPAHLASAFFVSPFEEAAVCAIDGFGDFVSTSFAIGRGHRLRLVDRTYFPHSLGLFYLALTQYLGFRRYGDEYKVMGLAPYGTPDFASALRRVVAVKGEGGFELDLSYFRHWSEGASMTWDGGEPVIDTVYTSKLEALLGPARRPDEPVEARHEAIAASLQQVFEETVFHVLNGFHRRTGLRRLCLAGGCAMNSVANGKIRERTPFRDVYVQPASADNGTSLGAAYWVWHQVLGHPRAFVMDHAYWGPAFDADAVQRAIADHEGALGAATCELKRFDDEGGLCARTAEEIAAGKIVGWFQGRMEWGARALGNRSILADPRRPDMRDIINTKIKFRERFRPFAPSVLEEAYGEFFLGAVADPFMIQVYPVRPEKRAVIPAVTHVDGSGRLQTVSRRTNRLYWHLIKAFGDLTGVPILLNTSFNENEPIVRRPEEALDCFLRTRMDVLVLGPYFIKKAEG
jgi:carbamoyltransferase